MNDIPDPWALYRELQAKLADRHVVDHDSWGLEAGLNKLLAECDELRTPDKIQRVIRSESRRERHRGRLRSVHFVDEEPVREIGHAVEARLQLHAVKAQVTDSDWSLLLAIAQGQVYGEIAIALGLSAGALRVRVLRLRRELKARLDR